MKKEGAAWLGILAYERVDELAGLGKIPKIVAIFNLLNRLIDQSDHVFHIFFVRHFYCGMHILQRKGNQYRGNAHVGISEGICICTRGSG